MAESGTLNLTIARKAILLFVSVLMLSALLLSAGTPPPPVTVVEVTLASLVMISLVARRRRRHLWISAVLLSLLLAAYATDEWLWPRGNSRPIVLIGTFLLTSIGSAVFAVVEARRSGTRGT